MGIDAKQVRTTIENGNAVLGIELGSTRIKAVLVNEDKIPVACGSHDWESRYENGIWTYSLEDIWSGLQDSYAKMAQDVKKQYGVSLKRVKAMGFSAMMHGYMAFDAHGRLLVPFRTWRNNITREASEKLTELFRYQIPQRWSISHLYQAILNGEEHVSEVAYLTTLAGYVHWKLTGEKVLGVGDASGMFPIDPKTKKFNSRMISKFQELTAQKNYPWRLDEILPRVLTAGEEAGYLTEKGAKLLDPSGYLKAGSLVCPPEGDAGTGMAATNSVAVRTGNVSAGTSVFAMVVLEKELRKVHPELDLVTTPDGKPVAMVHCQNCTSDLNAWVSLFQEFCVAMGLQVSVKKLYDILYHQALQGDADGGGLLSYCYFSGEHITGFERGCPLFVRSADSAFNLANFMRTHLFTALGALKIGLDILFREEGVRLDKMLGHGGLFKTEEVGQKIMAAAMDVPVSVMETAGEGGAWGIALLASYLADKKEEESLETYLNSRVFEREKACEVQPDPEDIKGFEVFMERYRKGLSVERAAVECGLW